MTRSFLACLLIAAAFLPFGAVPAMADDAQITIEPASGNIAAYDVLTLTFPETMASPADIDAAGRPVPFTSEPALPGAFVWKSATEGVFTIANSLTPGASYHLSLVPGLKTLDGNAVAVKGWSADFTAPPLQLQIDVEQTDQKHLAARAQVHLNANYDVSFPEVVAHTWFQERDTFKRHSVEVIQVDPDDKATDGTEFRVAPRENLPAGKQFDLVVEGLTDLKTRTPTRYMQVFPLGTTAPLELKWVGAFNNALERPAIRAQFGGAIEPDTVSPATFVIQPPVKNLRIVAENDKVLAEGDFDLTQRYTVTVTPDLKGVSGYGLPSPSAWGATFKPKPATVLFPTDDLILQRSAAGLHFSFLQVNTALLTWSLAPIPLEKLGAISARIQEFQEEAKNPLTGDTVTDPATGLAKKRETALLVKAFGLSPIASGHFDSSGGDQEILRKIDFTPSDGSQLTGPYLLEVVGVGDNSKFTGNHLIVSFSDILMTQKRSGTTVTLHLAKMSDGMPVPDTTVHALSSENFELARAQSNSDGLAFFSASHLFPAKGVRAHLFVADPPAGPAFQFADATTYESGQPQKRGKDTILRSCILTDRNLYRPGQTVKISGFARRFWQGDLTVPADETAAWWITAEGSDEKIAQGEAPLRDGAWEAEWQIPPKAQIGEYILHCRVGNLPAEAPDHIKIEEYRAPLFSVIVEPQNTVGIHSVVHVASAYFHGAPNAAAHIHWKASWMAANIDAAAGMRHDNPFSENAPTPPDTAIVEGDTILAADGTATLDSAAPFPRAADFARFEVDWRVDVTSPDGQTLTGGISAPLQSVPTLPGVRLTPQYPSSIKVDLDAINATNDPVSRMPVRADLFHVTSKTVKEQLAPFVFRYRNSSRFEKIDSRILKTPASFVVPVQADGRYVAAVTGAETQTPSSSDETFLSGGDYAEYPVEDNSTFKLSLLDKKPFYRPGDTADISVQAPFAGVAWVTVEADEILDTILVPLSGNAAHIPLPIHKEYAPNAWVTVYLLRPGGDHALPAERFASIPIAVHRPELELNIAPTLSAASVKPGETVKGNILVTSGSEGVSGANLTVFAVDDAVLQLGDWKLPDVLSAFYPERPFGVLSFDALDHYIDSVQRRSLTEKGFVIGDGGAEQFGNISTVRKEFKTLAFWQAGLRTDTEGKASFQFEAPDNLTTYRIVAIGETDDHQFGGSADQTVKVSKPLIVEPALPRFLRDGDELELRAVVRQNLSDSETVVARGIVDSRVKLTGVDLGAGPIQDLTRDVPAVYRFKAKVADPDLSPTKIRFEVVSKTHPGENDAVEVTLPVHPATIIRKEAVSGIFEGPAFNAPDRMPADWKQGRGSYDVAISTSPWLPAIAGLPLVLEYPHGCFEQITSRILGYSLLGDLLASLPNSKARDASYRDAVQNGLSLCDASLLPDSTLPYWSGETTANAYCTIAGCWAMDEAVKAGFTAPPRLAQALPRAVNTIATGDGWSPFLRAFALMVLGERSEPGDFTAPAQDVYLHREKLTDEGRALLALAMHKFNILPDQKMQLLNEIVWPVADRAFDPETFASRQRAEAICALAFSTIKPPSWAGDRVAQVRKDIASLMDSASSLSTQENLWALLTFKALGDATPSPALQANAPDLQKAAVSRNGVSAQWENNPLPVQTDFTLQNLNLDSLSFLMSASFTDDKFPTDRADHGFHVERVTHDLTDPKRTGEPDSPFKIGDQILITYRINASKLQNYCALEDLLPAGFEVVNPDLPAVAKFFELPAGLDSSRVLDLSHSEIGDQSARLYFDRVESGVDTYSILARATAAGSFQWPATQVGAMYDPRFSGLSPSSLCVITGD